MNPRIPGDVVIAFPAHPDDCDVCGGERWIRWCGMHRNQDRDWVSSYLGMRGSCLTLPVLDVPFRVDVPVGSAPVGPEGGAA